MNLKTEAYLSLGTSYRFLDPDQIEQPRVTYRDLLFQEGRLLGIEHRPTLRMTYEDRVRAAQHLDDYWYRLEQYEVYGAKDDPRDEPWQQDRRVMP